MTAPSELDRLAARALPGAEEERAGGWLLRAAPGERARRTSSALPEDVAPDVAIPERWYAGRGLPALVMVTPEEERAGLDADLAARGWTAEGATDVLTGAGEDVLDALGGPAHRVVPADLTGPPGVLRSADPVVALGAAAGAGRATVVLHEQWSLLLALEVAPEARRRGIAAALVRAWARLAEGRGLYVQVERDNAPAQALWTAAGLTRSHGYHYRRAPA